LLLYYILIYCRSGGYMKKNTLIFLAVLLLGSLLFSLPIEEDEVVKPKRYVKESKMNVFVDLGLASGDFKGFFTGLGFQYGFAPDFFSEILIDVNFNPIKSSITNTALGVSINGVYKLKMSENVKMFVKGGMSSTSLTASYGSSSITSDPQLGLNAGLGTELALSKKMGVRAGSTFKIIFDPGKALTYFTFCGSFYYNL
jgi:opacity protein-like surface antigen